MNRCISYLRVNCEDKQAVWFIFFILLLDVLMKESRGGAVNDKKQNRGTSWTDTHTHVRAVASVTDGTKEKFNLCGKTDFLLYLLVIL